MLPVRERDLASLEGVRPEFSASKKLLAVRLTAGDEGSCDNVSIVRSASVGRGVRLGVVAIESKSSGELRPAE